MLLFIFTDLIITIVQRIKTTSVLEGETCTFDCHLSHELDDEPSWTINGEVVVCNGRILIINDGRKYSMTIREATLTDAGEVVFTIKDLSCRTMLFVKGQYLVDSYQIDHKKNLNNTCLLRIDVRIVISILGHLADVPVPRYD